MSHHHPFPLKNTLLCLTVTTITISILLSHHCLHAASSSNPNSPRKPGDLFIALPVRRTPTPYGGSSSVDTTTTTQSGQDTMELYSAPLESSVTGSFIGSATQLQLHLPDFINYHVPQSQSPPNTTAVQQQQPHPQQTRYHRRTSSHHYPPHPSHRFQHHHHHHHHPHHHHHHHTQYKKEDFNSMGTLVIYDFDKTITQSHSEGFYDFNDPESVLQFMGDSNRITRLKAHFMKLKLQFNATLTIASRRSVTVIKQTLKSLNLLQFFNIHFIKGQSSHPHTPLTTPPHQHLTPPTQPAQPVQPPQTPSGYRPSRRDTDSIESISPQTPQTPHSPLQFGVSTRFYPGIMTGGGGGGAVAAGTSHQGGPAIQTPTAILSYRYNTAAATAGITTTPMVESISEYQKCEFIEQIINHFRYQKVVVVDDTMPILTKIQQQFRDYSHVFNLTTVFVENGAGITIAEMQQIEHALQ